MDDYETTVVLTSDTAFTTIGDAHGAVDLLLDAAALIAQEHGIDANDAFQRFKDAYEAFTGADEMAAAGQSRLS